MSMRQSFKLRANKPGKLGTEDVRKWDFISRSMRRIAGISHPDSIDFEMTGIERRRRDFHSTMPAVLAAYH